VEPVIVGRADSGRAGGAVRQRGGSEEDGITLPQATPPGAPFALSLTSYRATRQGGGATVTMRVTAENQSTAPVDDLTIVMPNGHTIRVGTIPPSGQRSSDLESLSLDVSRTLTHSMLLPVTLRFGHQNEAVERASALTFRITG
jgi:hypothetical protein